VIEPLRVKEGGVRYQVVGDWARLAAGLDPVVKRIIFVLSGNEPWPSMPLSWPISIPQGPETPFYKGILTVLLLLTSMTEVNVGEIPMSGD